MVLHKTALLLKKTKCFRRAFPLNRVEFKLPEYTDHSCRPDPARRTKLIIAVITTIISFTGFIKFQKLGSDNILNNAILKLLLHLY